MTGQLVVMGEREGATGETNLLLTKENFEVLLGKNLCAVTQQFPIRVSAHKFLPTPRLRKQKCITMKICLFIQSEIATRVKMFN